MKKKLIIIIILISLIRFINLGFGDINPWDEAMYAIRAKGIIHFHQWIDQTPFSVGGLYTSSHPPLYIWLTAILFKLFGISNISVRFFSGLFGALTIIIIYFCVKKILNRTIAFFSVIILGLNTLFTHYSRQGQLDILYTFFVSFSLLLYLIYLKQHSFYKQGANSRKYLIFSGIIFGFALMSKILVGFYVPIIIFPYLLYIYKTQQVKFSNIFFDFSLMVAIGLFIALPWHFFMLIKHGKNFLNYFLLFHVFKRSVAGVEHNVRELGFFYFVNQLLVRMPVFIMCGLWGIFSSAKQIITKKSHSNNLKRNEKLFFLFWFLIIFVIISLFKTKLNTYLIPAIIPISIFAGYTVEKIWRDKINKKNVLILFFFTILNLFWSINFNLRQQVKEIIKSIMNFSLPSFISIFSVIVIGIAAILPIILLYWYNNRNPNSPLLRNLFIFLLFFCLLTSCIYYDFIYLPQYYNWEIQTIRKLFDRHDYKNLIVIGKYKNAQIGYYFDGAGVQGWDSEIKYKKIREWNHNPLPTNSLIIVEKFGFDETILPYLQKNYYRELENHRYIVFSKKYLDNRK